MTFTFSVLGVGLESFIEGFVFLRPRFLLLQFHVCFPKVGLIWGVGRNSSLHGFGRRFFFSFEAEPDPVPIQEKLRDDV